jgi:hypothetical protein
MLFCLLWAGICTRYEGCDGGEQSFGRLLRRAVLKFAGNLLFQVLGCMVKCDSTVESKAYEVFGERFVLFFSSVQGLTLAAFQTNSSRRRPDPTNHPVPPTFADY